MADTVAYLLDYVKIGVLVTVFIVGLLQTVFSQRGFIGMDGISPSLRLKLSAIMLLVSALGIFWAVVNQGDRFITIGVPIISMLALTHLLKAWAADNAKNTNSIGIAAAAGASNAAGVSDEHTAYS